MVKSNFYVILRKNTFENHHCIVVFASGVVSFIILYYLFKKSAKYQLKIVFFLNNKFFKLILEHENRFFWRKFVLYQFLDKNTGYIKSRVFNYFEEKFKYLMEKYRSYIYLKILRFIKKTQNINNKFTWVKIHDWNLTFNFYNFKF